MCDVQIHHGLCHRQQTDLSVSGQTLLHNKLDGMHDFLQKAGFDIWNPFPVARYNEAKPTHPLPVLGHTNPIGILVGNTRALWEPFIAALANDETLRNCRNPLDTYVTRTLVGFLDTHIKPLGVKYDVVYTWDTRPGRLVSFQTIGRVAGLGHLSKGCGLSLHPVYGPWFAMRAVVVLGMEYNFPTEPVEVECPLTDEQEAVAAKAMETLQSWTPENLIAMRRAVPLGQEWEYSRPQLMYHYTLNKQWLTRNE